jgi:hypothetical protein
MGDDGELREEDDSGGKHSPGVVSYQRLMLQAAAT